MTPPHRYAPFYCEENAWWLARTIGAEAPRSLVVFIANPARACALWSQRAGRPEDGGLVIWDYHVVLWTEGAQGAQIWDLDCVGGCPLPAATWTALTFPCPDQTRPIYWPWFRRVDAATFARDLRSDRRHMRDPNGAWRQPPPPWPAPCDPTSPTSNLFDFARIDGFGQGPGEVLDWAGWRAAVAAVCA